MKHAGERSAGNPHAAFDVEGAGNVTGRRDYICLPELTRQFSTLLMREGRQDCSLLYHLQYV